MVKAMANLGQNHEAHKLRSKNQKELHCGKVEKTDIEARQVWIQVLCLALTSCVPLGKSVKLSEPVTQEHSSSVFLKELN